MCGQEWEGVGLSSPKSSAVGCLERLAGGPLRSDLEGVEAVVVLDGADTEGGWMGLPEHLPLLASAPKTDSRTAWKFENVLTLALLKGLRLVHFFRGPLKELANAISGSPQAAARR